MAIIDMRGDMAPFDISMLTMQSLRLCIFEQREKDFSFQLKLSVYHDGTTKLVVRWSLKLAAGYFVGKAAGFSPEEIELKALVGEEVLEVSDKLAESAAGPSLFHWSVMLSILDELAIDHLLKSQTKSKERLKEVEDHRELSERT